MKVATFWLTLMSFFFYGWWDFHYIPLLFGSICFNYLVGQKIEATNVQKNRKIWLYLGIAGNVMLLGMFKYTGFCLDTINLLTGNYIFVVPQIVLPLGISFFTFTQTAYLVEVYRKETESGSFLTYCEFVTIFPHLIAGPIINHREMLPQFTMAKNFVLDYRNVAMGICLFSMGLFKKVAIADHLSPWVANIFSRADSLTLLEAWIGAISYTFQLYFDFSGYSEMAIGLGLMFNLQLPVNFNSPYQARSIIDFWRRWHMTLGLWVKNYLYIPMGGNRNGEFKKMRNLFVAMLIIGLWHGAGWTFVIWGGMHGVLLMLNHQWRRLNIALPKAFNWALTFLCVVICWVFFRADNFHDAWAILYAMVNVQNFALPSVYEQNLGFMTNLGWHFIYWDTGASFSKQVRELLLILIVLATCTNPVSLLKYYKPNYLWLIVTLSLLLFSLYSLNAYTEFLYFQF